MKAGKRLFDILCAASLIIVLSPLIVLLACFVRIKLGSPCIFVQKRPGFQGRIFTMYKFRSMTDERTSDGRLLSDEKRLVPFGKFLRSTSLDELPELFNILKGEMSFVGPRPQLVRDMVFFDERTMRRQTVVPGLTGWAQVNGRNAISWEEKFRFDLEYVEKASLFFDLKILFLTVGKVFRREDIQAEGMETAEDYGDYLLRTKKITQEEYEQGLLEAERLLSAAD